MLPNLDQEGWSCKPEKKEEGLNLFREFGKYVRGQIIDAALEELGNTLRSVGGDWIHDISLPVIGPAPTPKPSMPERDVFESIIETHTERG
jgi:hypothetical protein